MCGICGYAATDPRTAPGRECLRKMTDALAHRGPDDAGQYLHLNAGLGARRLSIIDVEGGHQPLGNEDETVWVVQNGEILNYRALRTELQARGHRFRTATDTEVLVHLYEEEGPDFVSRLRGMFAVAVWDTRLGTLLLARDRLGIKPLYYAAAPGLLVFASELKGLLHSVPFPLELDLEAVDQYMTLGYVPSPRSILTGIRKLPPAHVLLWRDGQTTVRPYWAVRYDVTAAGTVQDTVRKLRGLLEDAVQAWTVSDVPVGAFLSGGLDSSAVTALMATAVGGRPMTFSIGFTDRAFDELSYARKVAEQYGTDHHELIVDTDQAALLTELAWFLDEPLADDSAIPTFLVSRLARTHVKVALSGDGGDELFGGYTWTYRDQLRGWYRKAPRLVQWLASRAAREWGGDDRGSGRLARIGRGLRDAAGSMGEGYLRRTTVPKGLREVLYHPRVSAALNGYDGASVSQTLFDTATVKDPRERMLYVDQHLYLPDDILFKVDRMSMANSLEARPPLLDHALVEFAASIPYDLKIRGFTSKYLFKQAVAGLLPRDLLRQRKHGFSMPVGRWLRGKTGRAARELLLSPQAARRELWSLPAVRRMLDEHEAGRRDFTRPLWSLLVFENWARLYLDGTRTGTPPQTVADLA